MESQEARDNDVYGLLGGLCEVIFLRNRSVVEDEQPYLPQESNGKYLRRLKARAYEILLKKSPQDYGPDSRECDPIVELLKHAFTLKTEKGRFAQAAELQKYLDEFIDDGLEQDSAVYSTLQFLNCLKSVEAGDDDSLDVFYYDRPHPSLPEMYSEEGSMPPYQVYPLESFHLPKKFEDMFKQEHGNFIRYNTVEPGSQLALLGRFTIPVTKSIRPSSDSNTNVSQCTTNLPRGMNLELNSYFLPQIKDIERSEEHLQPCIEGIVTEPESPWQGIDPLQSFIINDQDNLTEIYEIEENEVEEQVMNIDRIWEEMDKISALPNHATWETLGSREPLKEPPFASESIKATIHLMNIAQDILSNQSTFNRPLIIVPSKEFISNIKLLLLGVESSTFIHNSTTGFELKKDVALDGISPETLQNVCSEVTLWGTCFRNLSNLIVVDPQSGKLQIEGLIFKALCGSIKEFLLFYHAAILKVSINESGNSGLLNFLKKVRPLGNLILKVAQLCRCDSHRLASLDEGIGILTHIYKEVTKVTEQNVALVFYSILKDCCEVYFRFLQRWIFEGACEDIYNEFMIAVRPKYVRTRGYRFWTKAFGINEKSVPGFLSELTDSILQCGKAVMLLKICDPKNPLCRVSASSQPTIRVCLSVGMLREQAKFYEDYTAKGELEQGEVVSLSTAIQQQKDAEKKRAELVIAAQQDTLTRLRKEREESLRKVMKEKLELLEQLKDQAEEAVQRKERERDAELLADKILSEKIQKQEEEAKMLEVAEREKTIKYYNELAEEAKKRKIHAEWRIRRMKLFDERLESICDMRREFASTPDTDVYFHIDEQPENTHQEKLEDTVKVDVIEKETTSSEKIIIQVPVPIIKESIDTDENSNPTSDSQNDENENSSPREQKSDESVERVTTTKAVRPTVLDITSVNSQKLANDRRDSLPNDQSTTKTNLDKTSLDLLKLSNTDNITQAQRNKLKVLQQEYGFTPNNNESSTILADIESNDDQSEIHRNRLRNTQHLTHLNWDGVNAKDAEEFENTEQESEDKAEINLNRLRNTQHLTHLNWDDINAKDAKELEGMEQESEDKTEINLNRLRNTQHLTHLNWDDINAKDAKELEGMEQESEDKTEINLNRLRNTQHLTHLNWDDINAKDAKELEGTEHVLEEKTEIQLNRLRNTQHLTDFNYNQPHPKTTTDSINNELTEAEINRNKVMSHFYSRMDELDSNFAQPAKPEGTLTDWQRNRNRNMAHNIDRYDFEINRFPEPDHHQQTPMSTTTDHFASTNSTHSGSMMHEAPSCANTPFSEIDLMSCVRSTDGMSTEDGATSQQSRGSKYFQDTPLFPNFFGFGSSVPSTPANEQQQQQLTTADVEMIDTTSLHVYLEKSVLVPLRAQSRLVNNAIIKYLLNEHNMLSHLHSLRSYFFLLNGEFAKTLTQSLFTRLYEVSAPVELFNSSTLMSLLEKALVSSLSSTYANSELLSLSVTEVPTYLQLSNPNLLACLSLNYKMSWPLNIVFNDVIMQQYSRVFKFLLMVGRVFWVLQEDFQILKVARKASVSQNHHKLQLYRHSMMQFMNALHTYLTCGVLHASWSEFERDLENAKTLDEVYNTHVRYIRKILSRCMLNVQSERLRTCLSNIFKLVLKFHNRIRLQNWADDAKASNYNDLERMYLAFCEQRNYLAYVAKKHANRGYQPHLMQFLHALNINHRYDLSVKN